MHIDHITITLRYEGGVKSWNFPYERAISDLDTVVDAFMDDCDTDPDEVAFTHRINGMKYMAEVRYGTETEVPA